MINRRKFPGLTACASAAALVLSLATSAHAQQQPNPAPLTEVQAAGVIRVKEMIEAVSSGNDATIRAYFGAQLDPNGVVNALARYRVSGGYDLVRVELVPSRPDLVAGIVRNRITGDEEYLAARIEPQAPHRIILFMARAPDEVAASWKLKRVTSTAVTEKDRLEEIGSYLKRMADAGIWSGAIVIARDGKPVFAQAHGYADHEKKIANTPETPFLIGSLNKLFTGLAIGQLVERGKLSYDDPLSKFIPDFPDPESAKKIRIKHLLSHTSGLAREGSPIGADSSEPPTTVKGMVAALERKPLTFEPGTKWTYSNMGFLLLGRVIEIATGQDYYDYVLKNVFARAGATSVGFPLFPKNGVPVAPMAYPYAPSHDADGRMLVESQLGMQRGRGSPAGSAIVSGLDLIKLSNAMKDGRIVQPETFRLHSSAKPELGSPNYGYGFIAGPYMGRPFVGHNGRSYGQCTEFGELRDTPYTVVVLSNLYDLRSNSWCRQVTERILRVLRPS
ncbi:MAG TPA: serine hydrolase domain-containing protein [Gemmatimonadaceae bacterium]|nr:serine hydrolase domain-containing protein [Gemmatimonadaceae bacterium]